MTIHYYRTLNDPERHLFKKGARDAFIMTVPRPLGELNYLRIWTDSCALGIHLCTFYLSKGKVHIHITQICVFSSQEVLSYKVGVKACVKIYCSSLKSVASITQ